MTVVTNAIDAIASWYTMFVYLNRNTEIEYPISSP